MSVIVDFNPKKWASIKPEVRAFTHANWARFEEEQPPWFNPGFIAKVSDEMIPIEALARLNRAAGGKRKRSSLGLSARGALTPSTASLRGRRSARDKVAPAPE